MLLFSQTVEPVFRLDLATDDQALNLGGALIDFADTDIAIDSFHGKIIEISEAAVNLDGVVAHLFGGLGGEQLRHRCLLQAWSSGIAQGRGADPSAFEVSKCDLEALPFLAEHLLWEYYAVVEYNLAMVRGPLTHGVFDLAHDVSRSFRRYDKCGKPPLASIGIGNREDDGDVGGFTRRNELLHSI